MSLSVCPSFQAECVCVCLPFPAESVCLSFQTECVCLFQRNVPLSVFSSAMCLCLSVFSSGMCLCLSFQTECVSVFLSRMCLCLFKRNVSLYVCLFKWNVSLSVFSSGTCICLSACWSVLLEDRWMSLSRCVLKAVRVCFCLSLQRRLDMSVSFFCLLKTFSVCLSLTVCHNTRLSYS